MRGLRKSIRRIDDLTQRVKEVIPKDVDRLAGLSPRARAICLEYIATASPERKYRDLIIGEYPLPAPPGEPVMIAPSEDAEAVMQIAYMKALDASQKLVSARSMFKKLQEGIAE